MNAFFKNNKLDNNNQLYEILLTYLNTDKRKKSLNNNEGMEFLSYLLSENFKNENNININNENTIELLKNRKSFNNNVIDAFIEKIILDNCFLENKNEIKIIKKRI